MASRPIFVPVATGDTLVATHFVEFDWFPGMSASQKQRSIASLHQNAIDEGLCRSPLEISSKSENQLGVQLSAFNLKGVTPKSNRTFTVETAFQSSKVFENGGPYTDLLFGESRAAKKDPRIQDSGRLVHFDFFGRVWDLEPRTAFYDWLYLSTLNKNKELAEDLSVFDAFTDIEFNPQKSINCQAYSVALHKSLSARGILEDALQSKESFLAIVNYSHVSSATEDLTVQGSLI